MRHTTLIILTTAICMATPTLVAADVLSLAGTWHFALDRDDRGIDDVWYLKNLPNAIQLPGVLEAQGYGDLVNIHTPWVLSLYDHFWYLRRDYAAFTNAWDTKVPFLCQPPRHYLGAAWYQRSVDIPAGWSDKHVVLFLERPHWKTTVWLDDRNIGANLSLCAPHEYELGMIAPGRHRITICVDNRMILPYRPDAHSVSDSLDDAWNGIVGEIELRAKPLVWIKNLQVFPNLKARSAIVHAQIGNSSGQPQTNKIWLAIMDEARSTFFTPSTNKILIIPAEGTNFQIELFPRFLITEWDEFHPVCYTVGATIGTRRWDRENVARYTFGFRELRTDGTQFILNGHPIYFRGTHFGGDFPLTGYPPTDVASWTKIFATCKSYGLNHMRFHSWCPPEAAFEAADKMGFYLQVECGMWNAFTPGGEIEKQLYQETARILEEFGNHPSLMLISASNEAAGRWKQVLPEWVKFCRREDPRHLYTPDTGWALIDSPDQPINGGADYLAVGRIGPNHVRGERGWFGGDYSDAIARVTVPVIAHEVGQWVAYPNFDIIQKFTGFMRPGNFEIFRQSAEAHGLLANDKDFAWASGRFQLECYKEEVEANLRTPGLAGFQLLDLHDYTGQGTALVGVLDPFWDSKGYTTPEEFRQFCNTIVPLVRLKQRVFTTADKFEVPVDVANFSDTPMTNAQLTWDIRNSAGKIVLEDAMAPKYLPLGKGFNFGTIATDLSKLPAPGQYLLEANIRPQPLKSFGKLPPSFKNTWNFWLYPAQILDAVPTNILVTSSWSQAEKALTAGGKVLFMPRNADLDWDSPPLARVPVFWNSLMGPTWSRMLGLWCNTNSPALAEFPTEPNCDWQWTELLGNTRAINLDHLSQSLQPIVSAIDDWNRNYKLGLIFEAKVGSGKLLVCAPDLNNKASPVAQQLRRSLLNYMDGHQFLPTSEISLVNFESLRFDTRVMHKLRATVVADGRPADQIIDGDPNTYWCSADSRGRGPQPPHTILVTFPKAVPMNGLVIMPRQNQREHQGDIREFAVSASKDGTNWFQVTSGQLASTFDEQKILFSKTVSARFLNFTSLSGFGTDHSAALAELAIMYAGPQLADEPSSNLEYKSVRTASPDIDAGDVPTRTQKQVQH